MEDLTANRHHRQLYRQLFAIIKFWVSYVVPCISPSEHENQCRPCKEVGHPGVHSGWRVWWRHQRETFSALLAICAGNSLVTCEFPTQRPVTRSFVVTFDLRLNKRSSKQSWGWWFQTPSCPLWRQCHVLRLWWNAHYFLYILLCGTFKPWCYGNANM